MRPLQINSLPSWMHFCFSSLCLVANFSYEKLVNGVKKFDTEGLNSLKYRIKYLEHKILYTWILVDIRQDSVSNSIHCWRNEIISTTMRLINLHTYANTLLPAYCIHILSYTIRYALMEEVFLTTFLLSSLFSLFSSLLLACLLGSLNTRLHSSIHIRHMQFSVDFSKCIFDSHTGQLMNVLASFFT